MWRGIRNWLFGRRQEDAVDQLSAELEQLKTHVLHDAEEGRDKPLEHQVDQLEAHIDDLRDELASNRQTLEHVIEALSHSAESHSTIEQLESRLHELEQQIEAISPQNRETDAAAGKTPEEASGRTSKRDDKREAATSGRRGDAVETAEAVERGKKLWEKATPAQRSIIQTMYDAGYPMSYKEIANEVGRSISTVKNHVNNLKTSGFDFKEDTGYNNTKKYMLDETVKTFLTMRLND